MSTNREKTSSVMGFVISILLHSIFFAACIAIDFTFQKSDPTATIEKTENVKMQGNSDISKVKS